MTFNTSPNFSASRPVKVGLVGTGYAARLRAETLVTDARSQLIAIAGHTPEKTKEFSQTHQAKALNSWSELVQADLDMVIVATINRDHGAIARAALQANKHVVVEYPLALDVSEAEELIHLAKTKQKLLHVEHIELLGGMHQALTQNLTVIGKPFYVRYATVTPQRPAPQKWTYHPDTFGFPLSAALSRIHRLTNAFGPVSTVNCQTRFQGGDNSQSYYTTCICNAQLSFASGLLAEVTYGKGETLWRTERLMEVHGENGALIFDGDLGTLVQAGEAYPIEVAGRRGLFAKDMSMVLDHLIEGTPLYVEPADSLYALKVADAARRSAETGQVVEIKEG